jgi:hypothetical protein
MAMTQTKFVTVTGVQVCIDIKSVIEAEECVREIKRLKREYKILRKAALGRRFGIRLDLPDGTSSALQSPSSTDVIEAEVQSIDRILRNLTGALTQLQAAMLKHGSQLRA